MGKYCLWPATGRWFKSYHYSLIVPRYVIRVGKSLGNWKSYWKGLRYRGKVGGGVSITKVLVIYMVWISILFSLYIVSKAIGRGFRVAQIWEQTLTHHSPHLALTQPSEGTLGSQAREHVRFFHDSISVFVRSFTEDFSQDHSCRGVVSGQWERGIHSLE